MDIQTLTSFFLHYGAGFIFLIVLLEYMNFPGLPAGLVMPLAGIWAAKGQISFAVAMALTVGAGLLGSWILYFLGRLGGSVLLPWYLKRFPKQEALIAKNMDKMCIRDRGRRERRGERRICGEAPLRQYADLTNPLRLLLFFRPYHPVVFLLQHPDRMVEEFVVRRGDANLLAQADDGSGEHGHLGLAAVLDVLEGGGLVVVGHSLQVVEVVRRVALLLSLIHIWIRPAVR